MDRRGDTVCGAGGVAFICLQSFVTFVGGAQPPKSYYGMIAAVVGSIVGCICTIFVDATDTGTIQLAAIPILPIVEAAILSVGACLLAAAMPLHSISKMNIVESIEMIA